MNRKYYQRSDQYISMLRTTDDFTFPNEEHSKYAKDWPKTFDIDTAKVNKEISEYCKKVVKDTLPNHIFIDYDVEYAERPEIICRIRLK